MSYKASVASTTHATTITTTPAAAVAASSSSSTPPSTSSVPSPNAPSGTTMTKISTCVSDKSISSPQNISSTVTATVTSSTTVPSTAIVATKGTGTKIPQESTISLQKQILVQEPVSVQNEELQQAATSTVIQNQKLASEQESSLQLKHPPHHLPQQQKIQEHQQINQKPSKAEDKPLQSQQKTQLNQEKHSQGQIHPKQTQIHSDRQQQQMQQKQTDTQKPQQITQQPQNQEQEKQHTKLEIHRQNHPQDKKQSVAIPKDCISQQQAQKPHQHTDKQPSQKHSTDKQQIPGKQALQLTQQQSLDKQSTQKQSTEKQPKLKQTEKLTSQSQPTLKQSTEKQSTQKQSTEKLQTQNQPPEKQPAQKQLTDKQQTPKQSTDKQQTPKQSTEKQLTQQTQNLSSQTQSTKKQSTEKQLKQKQTTEKQPSQINSKQSAEKQTTQLQSTQIQSTEVISTQKQQTDKQTTHKTSTDKQPAQKQSTEKQQAPNQLTEKQSAQQTQKHPIENLSTQKQTIQHNQKDKQTTEKPTLAKQAEQTQQTQKQTTDKQSVQKQSTEKQPLPPNQKSPTEKQPLQPNQKSSTEKQPIQKESKDQLHSGEQSNFIKKTQPQSHQQTQSHTLSQQQQQQQPQSDIGGQCGEKTVISASIGDKVAPSRPNLVTTTTPMSPTKRSNSGSPQFGVGQNISPLQINKTASKGRDLSPTRSPRISPTRAKVSPTRDKILPSVIHVSPTTSPGPVNVTSTSFDAAATAAKSATAVAVAAAAPSATSAKCQVVVVSSRGKNNIQRLPTIQQSTDVEQGSDVSPTQKNLPSKTPNSTTACKSPTEKTKSPTEKTKSPTEKTPPGVGNVKKPPPSHRPLIRHNSLAMVLGLFRGNQDNRDVEAGDGCKTLREESPEIMDNSSGGGGGGNSNSRSHSIPSTSHGGVCHFPEGVEARRIVPPRRRSCTSDLEILPEGPFVVNMSPPHSHAIKCKPLNDNARAAQVPRRCSLTLPYATLYGSWQSTVSPAGSRHGSNEPITCGARQQQQRQHESHSTAQTPHGQPTDIPEGGPASKSCYTNSVGKQQLVPSVITSPSSPDLHSSYSSQPLLDSMHLCGGGGPFGGGLLCRPFGTSNNTQLLASSLQKVPMKDFGSEVRASLDIGHFLQSAALVLDEQECSLEGITDLLLRKLIDEEEPLCTIQEAKSILFTHDTASCDEKESMSKVHLLARTIQGTAITDCGTFDYDQSWICALGNLPTLTRRHVAIARLKHPANMGRTSKQVKFFILVLCPSKEKGTKNSLETGRTFATIFADMDFRRTLLEAQTEEEFKRLIIRQSQLLAEDQRSHKKSLTASNHNIPKDMEFQERRCPFARGLREDLSRRLPYYISDYKDGIRGHKTLQKVVSTTFFLYFACILPAIAFGVLNDHNTHGKIDVKKMLIGQVIGGVFYGVFSGQPLLVQLTTAPLAIYIKIIYYICEDFKLDFNAMYCAVGLWNSFFLVIYSLFDVSRLMRWSTRSTEEIFAIFISIAFCNDAFADVSKNFQTNYYSTQCQEEARNRSESWHNSDYSVIGKRSANHTVIHKNNFLVDNKSLSAEESNITKGLIDPVRCRRENSVLFLLLMFGTLWLGVMLYNFNKTPYLNASKREALADYALPVAVIVLSFIGSYVFRDIGLEHFKYDETLSVFKLAPLESLGPSAVCGAMGLGFSLSMLFFMDQNIGSAMVNNPCNKLKKGPAYHLDLLVVALMNGFLSLYTLPWMHACLPHSPLHVRSLADVEERVDQGHVYEIIVKVRETRVTGLLSNILIGLSIFLLPFPLAYIPTAVLDGLFLYMAVTALNGNQMFERITLLFMEQAAYPPNHYIRRVPQRSIHQFTLLQVLQLLAMCSFGFAPWPYMKMMFPILLLLLLPVRHKLVPMVIEDKYLAALDGDH